MGSAVFSGAGIVQTIQTRGFTGMAHVDHSTPRIDVLCVSVQGESNVATSKN